MLLPEAYLLLNQSLFAKIAHGCSRQAILQKSSITDIRQGVKYASDNH